MIADISRRIGALFASAVFAAASVFADTAPAVADRGRLPDWSGRVGRNPQLLTRYRDEVVAAMPEWPEAAD